MLFDVPNILLGVTAAVNIGLVWFVYERDKSNPINRLFSLFVLFIAFWAIIILLFRINDGVIVALYLMKCSYIAALLLAVFFYYFSIMFPRTMQPSAMHRLLIVALPTLLSSYILFPGALTRDIVFHDWGKEVTLEPISFIIFATCFLFFFMGGLTRLFFKALHSRSPERFQLLTIVLSVFAAGSAGIYYNLVLPSPWLENFKYIWSGPMFTFFFAVVILYSIFRYRLFNPRAILAEFFVFALILLLFIRILLTTTFSEQMIEVTLFIGVSLVGALLIRSVNKEVEARELIEKQEQELEAANRRQENLIHFISHEVKGYMTKSQGAFAGILEGDYGPITDDLRTMATAALADVRRGVGTVMDILDAGNFKKGTIPYHMEPFDLRAEVVRVVKEFEPVAKQKDLQLECTADKSANYAVVGDALQLGKHVISNLVDNAIKYTPQGAVRVSLSRTGGKILLSVEDSGVGITEEDKARLFTEGGRGKDSIKVNAHSTGYGLFIARSIIEAHHGRTWAESKGKDKGSTFYVELPAKDAMGGVSKVS